MPVTQSPANANNIASDDAILRSDVRKLGDLLGQSLVRQEGQELLDLVESVRKAVREGGGIELLEKLSVEDSVQLVRAFSTYFHLANVSRTSSPRTCSCAISCSRWLLAKSRDR